MLRKYEILVNARSLSTPYFVMARNVMDAIDLYISETGSRAYNISARRV